jgi:hypothetical protein
LDGTRCSAARVEAADAARLCPFRALPDSATLEVFALLPPRARLRSAAVCRAWLAALADPRVWACCVLSPDEGGDYCTDAVLHAVSARARGALQALDVAGCCRLSHAALLAVATANAGALLELRGVGRLYATVDAWMHQLECDTSGADLEALLRAAPLLRVLDTTVACSLHEVPAMLRREAPVRLCIRELLTGWDELDDDDVPREALDEGALLSRLSDMASHVTLTGMHVHIGDGANLVGSAVLLDAFVDVALARSLKRVSFAGCRLGNMGAHTTAALARLVSGGTLAALHVIYDSRTLLLREDGAASPLLTALRESTTLTELSLVRMDMWGHEHVRSAAPVLHALTAHPTLSSLDLSLNDMDDALFDDELDACHALVAADAPALTQLNMKYTNMGNAVACALFAALPLNTHLRVLHCWNEDHHEPTAAFFQVTAVPAVRANTSLSELLCYDKLNRAAHPAEAYVARRAAAASAGVAAHIAPLARTRTALLLLPRSIVARIFSLVPVDVRLRCLEVCFSWNMLLRFNPAVWASLDFSPAGGVVRPNNAMLAAAAAHASSKLDLLDVSGCAKHISLRAVTRLFRRVFDDDVDELMVRKLRVSDFHIFWSTGDAFSDFLHHVSHHTHGDAEHWLEADALCSTRASACNLLSGLRFRHRPGMVRIRHLFLSDRGVDASGALVLPRKDEELFRSVDVLRAADVEAFASAVAAHEPLTELHMRDHATLDAGALAVLVDAALTRHLRALTLCFRAFEGAGVALARLLAGSGLQELTIASSGAALFAADEDTVALCVAIRGNRALTLLRFANVSLWERPDAAVALLAACTSHPTLRALDVAHNRVPTEHHLAAGAALGALVAADAPALKRLDVSNTALDADGLRPLMDALPRNAQLLELCCARNFSDTAAASAFCRATLQPAVLANASLRKLDMCACACDTGALMHAHINGGGSPAAASAPAWAAHTRCAGASCLLAELAPRAELDYDSSGYWSY